MQINVHKIRLFRLHAHHLDAIRKKKCIFDVVGACGMQNTPPGAWETALFNRVADCDLSDMNDLLYSKKSLLQAWSFRGAPVVFPAKESHAFLSALVPESEEEWIYTHGIVGALDFLGMSFDDLLDKLKQTMPLLDGKTVKSKETLDQTLAEQILSLIPDEKHGLWNSPSMYGARQTVGGAAVSFLLRPCAFMGLVVFGERVGVSPTFTSYKNWLGNTFEPDKDAVSELTRKFLHCYGPATVDMYAKWLGCTGKQAKRMWKSIADEMEPVSASNNKSFILSSDRDLLDDPPSPQNDLLLLGGYDPYLDQRDRDILLEDKTLQKSVWKTTTNPGAIVWRGKIIGIWTPKKARNGMEIKMTVWDDVPGAKKKLRDLAEKYSFFRQQKLIGVNL